MLTITTAAGDVLESIGLSREIPPAGGLRLAFAPGRNGQPGLTMTIVDEPEPRDAVLDGTAVSLFVQPQAAALLDDKVLDVEADESGRPSFVISQQQELQ